MELVKIRANGAAFQVARTGRAKGGTAGREKKPAVPCRVIEILAGKGGFAGQRDATRTTLATRAREPQRDCVFNLTDQGYAPLL
jgi:hypothetical protein